MGLVSEFRVRRTLAEGSGKRTIGTLVDRRPLLVPEQSLVEAVLLMDQWETRQLAVVDHNVPGHLVGLVTMSDIIRAQARAARAASDGADPLEHPMSDVQEALAD